MPHIPSPCCNGTIGTPYSNLDEAYVCEIVAINTSPMILASTFQIIGHLGFMLQHYFFRVVDSLSFIETHRHVQVSLFFFFHHISC